MSREAKHGWICPVCNKGNAPDAKYCYHCAGETGTQPTYVPYPVYPSPPWSPAPQPYGPYWYTAAGQTFTMETTDNVAFDAREVNVTVHGNDKLPIDIQNLLGVQ